MSDEEGDDDDGQGEEETVVSEPYSYSERTLASSMCTSTSRIFLQGSVAAKGCCSSHEHYNDYGPVPQAELEEDVDPRLYDAQPARYNRAQPPGKAESQLVRGIRAGVRGGGQAHAGEGWLSKARTIRKQCAARPARGGCRSSGAISSNEDDDLTCPSHTSPGLRAPAHKRIDAARGIHAVIGRDLAYSIIWIDRRLSAREIWASMRKCCAGDP